MFRILITLHIIEDLFNISLDRPRPVPCSILDGVHLPCTKTLWDIEIQSSWETEYRSYLNSRKYQQGLNVGQLRRARRLNTAMAESGLATDLRNWSADLDSFSSMLLMAVSEF